MRQVDIMQEFTVSFLDEQSCRRFIAGLIHEKPACPDCGESPGNPERFFSGRFVKCRCGKRYNWATGTELSGIKVSCSALVMLMLLYETNLSDTQIAKILEIDRETARLWRMRLKGDL